MSAPLLLALLAAAQDPAAPVTYALDPAETELLALTRPAGALSGLSHPHVVRARAPEGEVVYAPGAPQASSVRVGFRVDDPALRRREGLPGALGEDDRRKIAEQMRSGEQLDARRHPAISFASTSVRGLEAGLLEVVGLLTIRGVAAEVVLPVAVALEGGVLRGEGKLRITHAQFGMKPISIALGTIRNAEEIELRLRLVGRAAQAAPSPER
jgi:polyisoprenoid-binding protein YceI